MRYLLSVLFSLLWVAICAAQTTDGGRGELPGMRKDIFDQMKDAKNKGPKHVKINDTEEKCRRIVSIGGANASALFDASRTCGAVGEWKRRVAEELSAVYFVGGWEEEWPKSEGEPVEIEFEDGNEKKEKKDKSEKKSKKSDKSDKSDKTDDEVTGDESKSEKDDGDDGKSAKETDGEGKDEKETKDEETKEEKDGADDR
eukprot:Skav221944  [mRNA]  locus=scaffold195:454455:456900:+ [translate_table: standard]